MRIIFTGGGTGGHIYPALALARYLKRVDAGTDILFVGARGGMEEEIIPGTGFPLETLPVQGIPRKLSPSILRSFYLLGKAGNQALKIIRKFQPDIIIGTGGYAAAPVLLAAIIKRKKVFLHEQNVVPGITNRFLAPFVHGVCLSFEASRQYFFRRSNLYVTGNPRASELGLIKKAEARRLLNFDPNLLMILVVSGSRGAAAINAGMVDFLRRSAGIKHFQVLYITGERYYENIRTTLQNEHLLKKYGERLQVHPYQKDMPLAMAAADIIVTRAGATTIAEITAIGLPAVVIPSPNVVHNHQLINAKELLHQGAAIVIEEKKLSGQILQQELFTLLNNPYKREQMQENSKRIGYRRAVEHMYGLIKTFMHTN